MSQLRLSWAITQRQRLPLRRSGGFSISLPTSQAGQRQFLILTLTLSDADRLDNGEMSGLDIMASLAYLNSYDAAHPQPVKEPLQDAELILCGLYYGRYSSAAYGPELFDT